MKKLMMALFVTATATTVMAMPKGASGGGDMMVVHTCKQAITSKNGINKQVITVELSQGGFTGIPTLVLEKVSPRKTSEIRYILDSDKQDSKPVGGAAVFRGVDGMSFSINLTTSPSAPNKATLVEDNGQVTQLNCVRK
ncbi:hypothetical protein CIK05_12735 [Bdellovibrio sp. qaytius]|nr:hypothetical protein CIK05_12735 [Bdellovibrio sp. qaytius]